MSKPAAGRPNVPEFELRWQYEAMGSRMASAVSTHVTPLGAGFPSARTEKQMTGGERPPFVRQTQQP
jgi:hypothetical protein